MKNHIENTFLFGIFLCTFTWQHHSSCVCLFIILSCLQSQLILCFLAERLLSPPLCFTLHLSLPHCSSYHICCLYLKMFSLLLFLSTGPFQIAQQLPPTTLLTSFTSTLVTPTCAVIFNKQTNHNSHSTEILAPQGTNFFFSPSYCPILPPH